MPPSEEDRRRVLDFLLSCKGFLGRYSSNNTSEPFRQCKHSVDLMLDSLIHGSGTIRLDDMSQLSNGLKALESEFESKNSTNLETLRELNQEWLSLTGYSSWDEMFPESTNPKLS